MKPLRHPGFHRRRELRLREEEDMRAFRREQRRFEGAMSTMTYAPDAASGSLINAIAVEDYLAFAAMPIH